MAEVETAYAAGPSHLLLKRLSKALRSWVARQGNIPRGRTIPMGAVPVEARGLRHMAPTDYVGARDHRPTTVSAPRFMFCALFGSATPPLTSTNADPKTALRRDALARRGAIEPAARAAFGHRLAEEGLRLGRFWRPQIVSAFYPLRDEPDTLPLLTALAAEGFATALPAVVGRGSPLTFRLWRPGEPTRARRNVNS